MLTICISPFLDLYHSETVQVSMQHVSINIVCVATLGMLFAFLSDESRDLNFRRLDRSYWSTNRGKDSCTTLFHLLSVYMYGMQSIGLSLILYELLPFVREVPVIRGYTCSVGESDSSSHYLSVGTSSQWLVDIGQLQRAK